MELTELRRNNLRKLVDKFGLSKLAVDMLGYNHPGYISSMTCVKPARNFSEKNARKYERLLKIEHDWFDVDHEVLPATQAVVSAQAPVSAAFAASPSAAKHAAHADIDDLVINMVSDAIHLAAAVCARESVVLPAEKFATLVDLTYRDAVAHSGQPRDSHVKQLVSLLK